jgi:hypothetical protein
LQQTPTILVDPNQLPPAYLFKAASGLPFFPMEVPLPTWAVMQVDYSPS